MEFNQVCEDFYTENYKIVLRKLKIYAQKYIPYLWIKSFPGGSVVNNPSANTGGAGSVLESGRFPRGGNGNPLQYSCLGNPWKVETRGLSPWGHKRVRHDLATKQ